MLDPFDVLGVEVDATPEQIARAYRRAARRTHPDVGGSQQAFLAVEEAYRTLADPLRRAEARLRRARAERPASSPRRDTDHGPHTSPGPPPHRPTPRPPPPPPPVVPDAPPAATDGSTSSGGSGRAGRLLTFGLCLVAAWVLQQLIAFVLAAVVAVAVVAAGLALAAVVLRS